MKISSGMLVTQLPGYSTPMTRLAPASPLTWLASRSISNCQLWSWRHEMNIALHSVRADAAHQYVSLAFVSKTPRVADASATCKVGAASHTVLTLDRDRYLPVLTLFRHIDSNLRLRAHLRFAKIVLHKPKFNALTSNPSNFTLRLLASSLIPPKNGVAFNLMILENDLPPQKWHLMFLTNLELPSKLLATLTWKIN